MLFFFSIFFWCICKQVDGLCKQGHVVGVGKARTRAAPTNDTYRIVSIRPGEEGSLRVTVLLARDRLAWVFPSTAGLLVQRFGNHGYPGQSELARGFPLHVYS
jgi:hypothetical protein